MIYILSDQGASSSGLVLEGRRDLLLGLVVSGETVDAGFDEDEAEFGILVFSVDLEVLADSNSLLDEMPQVLWDRGCKTLGLQDSQNLVTSHKSDLWDTMGITKGDTNLRRSETLSGEF